MNEYAIKPTWASFGYLVAKAMKKSLMRHPMAQGIGQGERMLALCGRGPFIQAHEDFKMTTGTVLIARAI